MKSVKKLGKERNILWPINICLKCFMDPAKFLLSLPHTSNVPSLNKLWYWLIKLNQSKSFVDWRTFLESIKYMHSIYMWNVWSKVYLWWRVATTLNVNLRSCNVIIKALVWNVLSLQSKMWLFRQDLKSYLLQTNKNWKLVF